LTNHPRCLENNFNKFKRQTEGITQLTAEVQLVH